MNEITKEEVIQRLKDIKYSVTIAKRAFEAVETFEMMANDIESDEEAIDIAIEALENQKTGHWIKHENPNLGQCMKTSYECSNCKVWIGCEYFVRKSYCPNCGAKMEGDNK